MKKKRGKWVDTGLGAAVLLLIAAGVGAPALVLVLIGSVGLGIAYRQWMARSPKVLMVQGRRPMPVSAVTVTGTHHPVEKSVIASETVQIASIRPSKVEVEVPQQLVNPVVTPEKTSPVIKPIFAEGVEHTLGSNTPVKVEQSPRPSTALEVPVTVSPPKPTSLLNPSFRIPPPPAHFGEAKWIPEGQTITVAGVLLPGGLLYVGTKLSSRRQNEPCLIDPSLPVAERGNYALTTVDYWPSYSNISPETRRAYLNWLAGGRQDSDASIGYVFLFFYGLERRVLVDSAKNTELRSEWPSIRQELLRLLAVYGKSDYSFSSYAKSLLEWLSLASVRDKTYLKTHPRYEPCGEVPFGLRLALGQAALDKAPVPFALSFAWMKLHPTTNLRTPAFRCKEEFEELFEHAYSREFGDGLVIAKNRTKLKLVHQPASPAFGGELQSVALGEIPDVSVLTAPIKKLQDMAEKVTKELDSYSRFLSRNPGKKRSLEGILLLPTLTWPQQVRQALQALRSRVGRNVVTLKFSELGESLGASGALNKEQTISLARALQSLDIGMEPDVLEGARTPKAEDFIVLFATPAHEVTSRATAAYRASLLTLQLASTVASADGNFSDSEHEHLKAQVMSWTNLASDHTKRLLAHLTLLRSAPVSLAALRPKLELLDVSAKDAVASFVATVAQADGMVSPDEVRFLEKVYKALGVDAKKVYTDVHAVNPGRPTVAAAVMPANQPASAGFRLDTERIAALQRDTAAVTAMLAEIFTEEDVPSQNEAEAPAVATQEKGLLGLDEVHSTMARMLMSRAQWSRAELDDVAADLDLMLDGALETINEAAFDAHDMPFIEGDASFILNSELQEILAA